MPHYILHIDTSTDRGLVAVSADGALLAYETNNESRNHAATINILINKVLDKAGISLDELAAITACAGPGSYTGLRIGVATAKGLCYALDKPLLLDNRLTLLAFHPYLQRIAASQFISLLYAREKEYFISVYNSDFTCSVQPQHITEEQLDKILKKEDNSYIITDVAENVIKSLELSNVQTTNNTQIDLFSWSEFAFVSYKCNNMVNLTTAEPFYLKQVYTHK